MRGGRRGQPGAGSPHQQTRLLQSIVLAWRCSATSITPGRILPVHSEGEAPPRGGSSLPGVAGGAEPGKQGEPQRFRVLSVTAHHESALGKIPPTPQQLPLPPRLQLPRPDGGKPGGQLGGRQPALLPGEERPRWAERLGGFGSPRGTTCSARSTVRRASGLLVGWPEGAGRGPAERGAWEGPGRCQGSGQLLLSLAFNRGDVCGEQDWRRAESRRPSLPGRRKQVPGEEEGGQGGLGALPGTGAAGSSWGGDVWHVWAD